MTGLHSIEYCPRWRESIALIVNLEYLTGSYFLHLTPMRDDESPRTGHRHAHNYHIRSPLLPPEVNPVSAHPGCGCLANTASTMASTLFHVFATPHPLHSHHRGMGQLTQALFTGRGPKIYKEEPRDQL